MKKKLFCLALCALLAVSLALPCFAEIGVEDEAY